MQRYSTINVLKQLFVVNDILRPPKDNRDIAPSTLELTSFMRLKKNQMKRSEFHKVMKSPN